MNRRFTSPFGSALLVLALFWFPTLSYAGSNANAKILIHITNADKVTCFFSTARPPCSGIVTSGRIQPYYHCPLLVTDGNAAAGVGAVECGIDYDADAIYVGWFHCAQSDDPAAGPNGPWPAPGSGNRIQWDSATDCQVFEPGGAGTGVTALAGHFYLAPYGPAQVNITTHPVSGVASVTDCSNVTDIVEGGDVHRDPSHLGFVTLSVSGTVPGYNPCGLNTPTLPTSWSRMKALLR